MPADCPSGSAVSATTTVRLSSANNVAREPPVPPPRPSPDQQPYEDADGGAGYQGDVRPPGNRQVRSEDRHAEGEPAGSVSAEPITGATSA